MNTSQLAELGVYLQLKGWDTRFISITIEQENELWERGE